MHVYICTVQTLNLCEVVFCAPSSQAAYMLESESCLHTILEMIDVKKRAQSPPLPLLQAALSLLQSLWQGRHDAALIALRSTNYFWTNLTAPLFSVPELPVKEGEEVCGLGERLE